MTANNPLFSANRLKLGVFGFNGRAPSNTLLDELYVPNWQRILHIGLRVLDNADHGANDANDANDAMMSMLGAQSKMMSAEAFLAFKNRYIAGAGGIPLVGTAETIADTAARPAR